MKKPVFVVGPKVVQLWLDEYSNAVKLDDPTAHLHYKFVNADFLDKSFDTASASNRNDDGMSKARDFLEEISSSLGITRYMFLPH